MGRNILRQRAWESKLHASGIDADLLGQDAIEPPSVPVPVSAGSGSGPCTDTVGGGLDEQDIDCEATWQLADLGAETWKLLTFLLALRRACPDMQAALDAIPAQNVWVVKPASKSRGRGIRCMRNLPSILAGRAGASTKASNYIVQKYIERPLLIEGYKFDIRQWVLVSSFAPLTVWFFEDCYLRFCCHKFTLADLADRFVHLANNSV